MTLSNLDLIDYNKKKGYPVLQSLLNATLACKVKKLTLM